ncbi:hypothetical protein GCM10010116_39130 [Microbispora rosea subsp. aerata]|nr:hypothetical protein [Microbispora rosea]GGO19474.1 hypothetical protein GCM10010116_39130 [Microbispora rosea subsp. aerata]GIH54406.1 hypothetical protein Mro02_13200 [Microbispora rosea subsp. aerata]GLJ81378.1 hypothetical protein GCM10017588_01010 [Microbispora rosea subsp. aerata]
MSHPNPFGPQPGQPYHPHPSPHPSGQMPGGHVPGAWHSASAHAPRPPRGGRRWLSYGATALVALLFGVGIGASGGTQTEAVAGPRPTVTVTEEAEPAPTVTVTETVASQAEPTQETEEAGPATTIAGDGQYLVGEDIKPGTYKTMGTDGGFACYWARLRNATGEFSAIIANDNITGPARVTLKKGEYFETKRCQPWKRVG